MCFLYNGRRSRQVLLTDHCFLPALISPFDLILPTAISPSATLLKVVTKFTNPNQWFVYFIKFTPFLFKNQSLKEIKIKIKINNQLNPSGKERKPPKN